MRHARLLLPLLVALLGGCGLPKLLKKGPSPPRPATTEPTVVTEFAVIGDTDVVATATLAGLPDEDAAGSSFAFTVVPGVNGVPADDGPGAAPASWTGTLELTAGNGVSSAEVIEIIINP